ncbi:hypothetical protein EDS67_06715 [candidate division KSB1 bacterium]|nr:MAG: hypothetical protein EDS67_06715 [candidate division KSB1 bacterium]MBC6949251.1 hypothetical protein [candidate division KSB1 bacterium]MCE7941280.1 hypothetical protein [Chlorobi bacterium CHB1]MDL1875099.1 hypothetical protein [Cytophagia bacterium CHB2]
MLTNSQAKEILTALSVLPPERILEVQHFVLFLKDRYASNKPVDESEAWTDEDIHDLTVAVLQHAEQDE